MSTKWPGKHCLWPTQIAVKAFKPPPLSALICDVGKYRSVYPQKFTHIYYVYKRMHDCLCVMHASVLVLLCTRLSDKSRIGLTGRWKEGSRICSDQWPLSSPL